MSVGIDGLGGAVDGARRGHRRPGGMVDGVRGEANDARMFQGAECPRTCECGDVIRQQGLHLLREGDCLAGVGEECECWCR